MYDHCLQQAPQIMLHRILESWSLDLLLREEYGRCDELIS